MAKRSTIQQAINLVMSLKTPKQRILAGVALVVILALGYNFIDPDSSVPPVSAEPPQSGPATSPTSSPPKQVNGYYTFENATLHEHRGNDGDSFRVLLPGESEPVEFRLYFVDCPEKYINPDVPSQAQRVREQAEDFGVSIEDNIATGKEAQKWVLDLLDAKPFTVYTAWAEVYDSGRFHAFIEVEDPDSRKPIYLAELLVRKGYARIHTWGEDTPDGRHWREYKDELRRLEAAAKRQKVGVWGR